MLPLGTHAHTTSPHRAQDAPRRGHPDRRLEMLSLTASLLAYTLQPTTPHAAVAARHLRVADGPLKVDEDHSINITVTEVGLVDTDGSETLTLSLFTNALSELAGVRLVDGSSSVRVAGWLPSSDPSPSQLLALSRCVLPDLAGNKYSV